MQRQPFYKKKATWAKSIYIIPQAIDGIDNENIFVYENTSKILPILKNNNFHFALIAGVKKEILSKPIVTQAQLFQYNAIRKKIQDIL